MVDEITPGVSFELGIVETKTTNYGGHTPEFWAERLTEKIVGYSEDNEPHVKEHAKAFKDVIYKVCLIYIKNAIKSYQSTLKQDLIKSGENELAKTIK